jgi:ankyrin repeat protein
VKVAETLLLLGAGKHPIDRQGNMPLHIAAARGDNHEMVELLLLNNCSPNSRNKDRETPLHLACRRDDFRTVKILVNAGASWNSKNIFRQTPLSIVKDLGPNSLVKAKILKKKRL